MELVEHRRDCLYPRALANAAGVVTPLGPKRVRITLDGGNGVDYIIAASTWELEQVAKEAAAVHKAMGEDEREPD